MKHLNVLAILILTSCSTISDQSEIVLIKYTTEDNIIFSNGNKENYLTSIRIAYYKNCILLELPQINFKILSSSDENNIYNNLYPNDTTYNYFIYKEGYTNGKLYDSGNLTLGRDVAVDSMLKSAGIHYSMLEIYSNNLGPPAEIKSLSKKKGLVETFISKTIGKNEPDTTMRYYDSGLRTIKFSFSPRLDQQKKSKLYKIRYVINNAVSHEKPGGFQMESISMVERLKEFDSRPYASLFNQFKSQAKL